MTEEQFDDICVQFQKNHGSIKPLLVKVKLGEKAAPKLIRAGTELTVTGVVIRASKKHKEKFGDGFTCLVEGTNVQLVVRYDDVDLVSIESAPATSKGDNQE